MIDQSLGFQIEQRVHGSVVNHITEPTMNTKQTALDAYLEIAEVEEINVTQVRRLMRLTLLARRSLSSWSARRKRRWNN